MIPFEPQTLLEMQERYPQALVDVHDIECIKLGTALPPSKFRQNRFDDAGGIRLFVSRDRLECGKIVLHLSASIQAGTPAFNELIQNHGNRTWIAFQEMALDLFRLISGENRCPRLVYVSAGCVPHWWIEE